MPDDPASLAESIHYNLRLYDWPWSYPELLRHFGPDEVAVIAALVELRFDKKVRRIEIKGSPFWEIP